MSAPSARPHRSLAVTALAPIALFFLSSCSGSSPLSPTPDVSQEASFTEKALRGRVAIKVANRVKLLSSGNLEVKVRALCPRGYVREESGLLQVEQGLAVGEGPVQLHLGGCTGRWQSEKVLVSLIADTPFRRGRARVLATFAVVNPDDPTGLDQLQAGVDKTVRIR